LPCGCHKRHLWQTDGRNADGRGELAEFRPQRVVKKIKIGAARRPQRKVTLGDLSPKNEVAKLPGHVQGMAMAANC